MTAEQLTQLPDDFLANELTTRLGVGMVEFDLMVQIANKSDDTRNPTVQWPADNPHINFGRIQITGIQAGCDNVMFNPAQLPSGIALSDDPTLLARAGSYAVSLGARLLK